MSLGAGERDWSVVLKCDRLPQTPHRRARWVNDRGGTIGGVFSQSDPSGGAARGVNPLFFLSFGNAINGILSRFPSRFSSAAKTDSNHDPIDDRQKPPNTPPMTRAA